LMICMAWGAQSLTELGYPDQGINLVREAIALGEELAHPASLVQPLTYMPWIYVTRREWQAAQERAEIAIAYSREHQLALWLASATIFRGVARAKQGEATEGIDETRQGMAMIQATGCSLVSGFYLGL